AGSAEPSTFQDLTFNSGSQAPSCSTPHPLSSAPICRLIVNRSRSDTCTSKQRIFRQLLTFNRRAPSSVISVPSPSVISVPQSRLSPPDHPEISGCRVLVTARGIGILMGMQNAQHGFVREDPWRIFRIMAEFVDSFETMSRLR